MFENIQIIVPGEKSIVAHYNIIGPDNNISIKVLFFVWLRQE